MRLDPEAARILDRLRAAKIPPWRGMEPTIGRDVYRERALLFRTTQTGIGSAADTTIDGPSGRIGIRLYRPVGEGLLPILIYLHGGGWTLGDLDTHDEVCRRLAKVVGCIVASVDYRLAPEHPYPAPLDDAVTAVQWFAKHGETVGADPRRLAIGGDSAGGNMSAAVCLRLRDEAGPQVAMQLLIYPATVAAFDTLSYHENAEGYLLTRADCIWFWENYLASTPATDPYACPAMASDFRNLPRALIITAGFDPLRDEGEVYGYKLRAAGVSATARRFPGMIHGFMGLPIDIQAARQATRLVATELHRAWADVAPVSR